MRLVLDSSVVVKAIRNFHGASAALIDEALARRATLLVSTALWLEYESVVRRPEHWVWPGFGAAEAEQFLNLLAGLCSPVEISFRWRGVLPDPDDEMVVEVAMNGRADALVTFNDRDFGPAAAQLGLVIQRPDAMLLELRSRP
ncbi:MAG: putative toxin-antitoxin system toxin component, PIN family [Rhodospirillales bacterium]|nr:putative toxin-antitoxin system toxin component, PIN family [Rhodospirillales bacterium]